jgi:hypothetical protein
MTDINLRIAVELSEILRTCRDVELAFKRRGYKFNFTSSINGYCINASIVNEESDTINYEFSSKTKEKCFLEAAIFLKQVQAIRSDFGLEIY